MLLIEDDSGDAELIRELLTEHGNEIFHIDRESRLQSAIERLADACHDIALLDLGLPDSCGLSTLDRFLNECPNTPVIVLTGHDDEELGLQAMQRGAQDFLTKNDLQPKLLYRTLRYSAERHRVESALVKAEEEWSHTFDTIPDLVAIIDEEYRIIKANKAMADAVNMSPEELKGQLCHRAIHGLDKPSPLCPHAAAMIDGKSHAAEIFEPRLGGTFLVSASPMGNDNEGPIRCVHVARDVSQFKEMQENLKLRVEELRKATAETEGLLEASKALIEHREFEKSAKMIFDVAARQLGAPAGYVALLNEDDNENELLFLEAGGAPCSVDPHLPMPIRGLRAEAYTTGTVVWDNEFPESPWQSLMPEGHVRLDNVLFAPMMINGKAAGVLGLANKTGGFDENDARIAAAFAEFAAIGLMNSQNLEALERSEKRFRAIFDVAAVGIDLIDADGRFLQVNAALASMLGYSERELLNMTVFDVSHPEDVEESRKSMDRLVRGETDSYRHEKRYIRSDGRTIWADLTVSGLRDGQGKHWGTIGVIRDVTSEKRSGEMLVRLATAVDQAAEAIEITNKEGVIVYVNPAFEAHSGYAAREVVGRRPSILKSGHHDDAFYKDLWETISAGETWRGRFVNRRSDGTLYTEDATISPVTGPDGDVLNYVAVKRDVTGELSLQKQLVKAQKMESIATMAGGIAHDFNNLLTVTSGYAELLLHGKEPDSAGYEELQTILHASQRGADLVKRILTFTKKVEINPRVIDLNEEVGHARKLLFRTIPKMIDIELSLEEDLNRVKIDPGQLEQAVLNLAVNAQHAMPEGGKLVLATSNVVIDSEDVRDEFTLEPGKYVMLAVSDTGEGIPKNAIDRIFEPFFTTKGRNRGTGLGLAMVYGIVTGHGGNITCESEPGVGTTFRMLFPAVDEAETPISADSGEIEIGGDETILIVDDEEPIRNLAGRILSKSGYTCLMAASGEEALDTYRQNRDRISVVLLDLIMPGMGGLKCLDKLVEMDPAVKVLVASGYSTEPPARQLIRAKARGVVPKPFRGRDLLTSLRRVLDTE